MKETPACSVAVLSLLMSCEAASGAAVGNRILPAVCSDETGQSFTIAGFIVPARSVPMLDLLAIISYQSESTGVGEMISKH